MRVRPIELSERERAQSILMLANGQTVIAVSYRNIQKLYPNYLIWGSVIGEA